MRIAATVIVVTTVNHMIVMADTAIVIILDISKAPPLKQDQRRQYAKCRQSGQPFEESWAWVEVSTIHNYHSSISV